ncbi:MAG: DUF3386 family protein [Planctomycetaceae bacterium]
MFRMMTAIVLTSLLTSAAQAHFLFIQISPHAEAGRTVEVFFSERATAGDPKFVAKIAQTELWRQDQPGKLIPLPVKAGTDRLRGYLPSGQAVSVVGRCEYGVLKRDKSFLLKYYPKAVSGKPEDLEKLTRHEAIPLEIMPRFSSDSVTLTVLHDGRPVPNTVVTTVDADLQNEELKTDNDGKVVWKLPAAGPYAVYVKHVTTQEGTRNGDAFQELREFATLGFDWPLEGARVDADAVAMFEKAIAARGAWKDFPGFTSAISVYLDGRRHNGTVTVKSDGEVSFGAEPAFEDEAAREWVRDQLHSMVIHRVPSSGIRSTPVLSFADTDKDNPLGRLLTFHGGRFASTYRIRDDEIIVVNRNLGRENMSLQMLESERNSEGKVLPRAYLVQYRDADTGAISRVETFRNRWQRVGTFDLPESIGQTISAAGGVSVRSLKLTSIKLN